MVNELCRYSKIKLDDGSAYVRDGSYKDLDSVDAVIFDCDGVLIDARKSYDQTIKKTVAYISKQLTGIPLPSGIITERIIYTFRSRGGFNSDWDCSYAILLDIFSHLPKTFIDKFGVIYKKLQRGKLEDLAERLALIKKELDKEIDASYFSRIKGIIFLDLLKLASSSDSTGIKSVENILLKGNGVPEYIRNGLNFFKSFLRYPGSVKYSLIPRVFDEIFYGSNFFREIHGLRAIFNEGSGLMEEEKVIVKKETLNQLVQMLGQQFLAVASGRGSESTKRTLGDLFNFLNRNAMIFLEDEESYINPTAEERLQIGKPQPYSLLKVSEKLPKFTKAIYVGDSTEDLLMVKKANKIDERFLFAGIYTTGFAPNEKLRFFKCQEADILTSSVNNLPKILKLYRKV